MPDITIKEEMIEDVLVECKTEREFQDRMDCVHENLLKHKFVVKGEYRDDLIIERVKEEPMDGVQVNESQLSEPDIEHELVKDEANDFTIEHAKEEPMDGMQVDESPLSEQDIKHESANVPGMGLVLSSLVADEHAEDPPPQVPASPQPHSGTCWICSLQESPFSRRPHEEKIRILSIGRPTPSLPNLVAPYKDRAKTYTRHFSCENYTKYEWLSGCALQNRLFCFPCLLFSSDPTVWSLAGFNNVAAFPNAAKRHLISRKHIESQLKLGAFSSKSFPRIDIMLDSDRAQMIKRHNEDVERNRKILGRLVDAICYLGKQELAFRGHDESSDSLNKGNYLELLDFLALYDQPLFDHLNSSTVFRGTSPSIQNELVDCIASLIQERIEGDLKRTSFIAIMIDETTDVDKKSQLSTVLRYVDENGVAQERFLGFMDVSSDRSASNLARHVCDLLEKLGIGSKLVAQTYDGSSVMAGDLSGVQERVRQLFPEAIFVHCYAHSLNLVLEQSAKCIAECRVFFETLNGLVAFFSHSTKRTEHAQKFLSKKLPGLCPTRWSYASHLVGTVNEGRKELINFFNDIISDPGSWNSDTITKAQAFLYFLQKFETVFLLAIYNAIFIESEKLSIVLQERHFDIAQCQKSIDVFLTFLSNLRVEGYQHYWEITESSDFVSSLEHTKRKRSPDGIGTSYRVMFNEILDNAITQMNSRFKNFKDFAFLSLLDSSKYSGYEKHFPTDEFEALLAKYPSKFNDNILLKNELQSFYQCQDFDFKGKEIRQLVPYMLEQKLDRITPEVFKLASLFLTIPSTSASVERSMSALKRIETSLRSTQGQQRLSNLSIISIEKDVLRTLRKSPQFRDTVIDKFCTKTRRIELIYK